MPRPKGTGVIKFLDATKQDSVAMRNMLFVGASPTPEETALEKLRAEEVRLDVRLTNLVTWRRMLRESIQAFKADGEITLAHAKAERQAHSELRSVEAEINDAEKKFDSTKRHIKETQKAIQRASIPRQREHFYSWHHRALELMTFHEATTGSTITTAKLQKQLRDEHFRAGARELQRFMRQCGVAGQQGKRSDLTSDNRRG